VERVGIVFKEGDVKNIKVLLAGAMILVLWGGVLLSQEVQKPYSCTFDKGVGEGIFTGVSLDQVWAVAVEALMVDWFLVVRADKPSGILAAERRIIGGPSYGLALFFEQRGPDVCVTSQVYGLEDHVYDSGSVAPEAEKDFYDKVAERLYPPEGAA
jgi:hypothetical protein